MSNGFPWTVFSANTLRPMVADIFRSGGRPCTQLKKEASINLLQNIEKHGLEAALKEIIGDAPNENAGKKRKQPEEEEAGSNAEPSSEPLRKRGRPRKVPLEPRNAISETVSAPAATSRSRGRYAPTVEEGLLTRRQAARTRGDNVPAPRSPRKAAPAKKTPAQAGGSRSGARSSNNIKPKSTGKKFFKLDAGEDDNNESISHAKPNSTGKQLFDGVEISRRPNSYVGKGKGKERETRDDEAEWSDVDAEGEDVEVEEPETASSILENSNKENEESPIKVADADVDTEGEAPLPEVREIGSPAPEITIDHIEAARPKGQDALIPDVPEIGSPAPQIAIEPTDDQIEEARLNHDVMSVDIGSPAPEITIEPMAEDDGEEIQFEAETEVTVQTVQFEGNGHTEAGGFLDTRVRPRLEIQRAGTPLNPEYNIEVFSPGSAQHDSDDEMWVASGINGSGLQAAGGGLGALDALDALD
ncbi:hypothetical protein K438DRAFT_1779860 [Mycena galopus ATCC 62051]|nr:hypothetical protein K438DRAFT_1779860 [Mycena galopus ATCC 62051]